jgi:hypothetical protein
MSKTKGIFKVEIRETCKICGWPLTKKRSRTFCSTQCRTKYHNKKHYKDQLAWMAKKRAEKKPGKIQCVICGGWYVQICSHTVQKHGLTGREYRRLIGKDVKKGFIPEWFRQIKSQQNYNNFDTIKHNLIKGSKNWYKPGDKRAGKYERSPETMDRLKKLNKWKKRKHSRISKNIQILSKTITRAKSVQNK